uniref:NADH dehydrogenase subunit 4 n=1 Tax=Arma chinensis TaxID=763200 RepID=UPI001D12D4A8|nr:NADH dehydrogenase subunit 4 [Arma chinensis]QZP40915.1 NADH dehydrogenase subunit 4 [Arma chinensis]URT60183.1 NADH dehydrogenase subunit 4 [Arma chinensis]
MMKYLIMLIFLIPLIYNYWLLMWVFMITCFLFVSFNYLYDFVTPFSVLLGMDLLSYSLIGLSYFIVFLMMMASYKIYLSKDKLLEFSFVMLVMMMSLLLTFSSVNMFIFYLSFEMSLIPTLFLIFGWGYQPERISAGYYLLFYTLFASLPLLLCIFYINILVYSLDFWFVCLDTNSFNFYIYLSLILAFLFKLPVPFFHFWLPKAHVEAPISGSMILAAILLKLGGYGLMRVYLFMSHFSINYSYFWVILSLWGALIVSFLCLFQVDIKSIIAYSSVAHMALVICGIMSSSMYGFSGSLIVMIGHGFCSSALFCLANIIYERSHSRSLFINKGYMMSMPSMSLFWFLLCSNNMSSPPSLNLLGEIYLINSIISWDYMLFLFLGILSFMSCCFSIYLFSMTQHGFIYGGNLNSSCVSTREYLLILYHFIPLNFLFLKFDFMSMFF